MNESFFVTLTMPLLNFHSICKFSKEFILLGYLYSVYIFVAGYLFKIDILSYCNFGDDGIHIMCDETVHYGEILSYSLSITYNRWIYDTYFKCLYLTNKIISCSTYIYSKYNPSIYIRVVRISLVIVCFKKLANDT